MFEWDDAKRISTLEKHGIDFIDAVEVFYARHLVLPARSDTEERKIAVGQLNGVHIAVIYTKRGDVFRVITARRARKNERIAYETYVHRGRSPP